MDAADDVMLKDIKSKILLNLAEYVKLLTEGSCGHLFYVIFDVLIIDFAQGLLLPTSTSSQKPNVKPATTQPTVASKKDSKPDTSTLSLKCIW